MLTISNKKSNLKKEKRLQLLKEAFGMAKGAKPFKREHTKDHDFN